MSKYLRNNIKLLAISGIMASVLVFSPLLSELAFAEGAEVAEVSSATEATASAESTAATEAATTTETTAAVVATDDDSDAEAVKSFIDNSYFGLTRELHISVSTGGGTYNGKSYIPPTISDDCKSVSFSSNVQRDGYTLVGFTTDYLSQDELSNATPDMSMPYTIDADGMVHMNFSDLESWSSTDNIDTGIITTRYHLRTLWAPNPEPEPTPAPEPDPEPAPAPVSPASDPVQQPAVPRREKSVLPNTGDASSVAGVVAAAGTVLTAFGFRKKTQQ